MWFMRQISDKKLHLLFPHLPLSATFAFDTNDDDGDDDAYYLFT